MAADQVNFTIKATTGGEETEEFEENQTQEEVQKTKKNKIRHQIQRIHPGRN